MCRNNNLRIFGLCFYLQRLQLLQLGVPATFMMVALDEGPGPPIRYQYAELGKLFSVVSLLVRCCDVSVRMRSSAAVSAVDVNSVILQLFSLNSLSIYLFMRHLFYSPWAVLLVSSGVCFVSQGTQPKANPFGEGQPVMEIQPVVGDILFNKAT